MTHVVKSKIIIVQFCKKKGSKSCIDLPNQFKAIFPLEVVDN